jgi:hypothetical protein
MNKYILSFLLAASLFAGLPIKYDTGNGSVEDAQAGQEYNFPAGTTIDGKNPTFNEDFDANTILGATTDNTPAAITIDEQRIVGRITAGNIGALTAAEVLTLLGVESGATADQTDGEIETAYNNQVSVVTQGAAESGTSTVVVRWTPERVKQAIDALSSGSPGGSDTEVQFNDGGVFGTDSLFVWDKLNNYLELGLGSSVGIGTATPQTELDIYLSTGKPTLTLSHDGFEGGRIDIYHTNGFSQPIQGRLEFYDDQANNADFVYYAKENPAAENTAIEEKFRYDSSENSLDVVGAVTVTDDAYAAGWNGSTEVPTKNAVYDKIETLPGSDQNLWLTIAGDSGSTAATSTTDTLTIAGGTDITTAMSGDTLTVNADAGLTRDTEWDTAAEINAATTDADFVLETDFDAQTILAATTDNTPAALTVATDTLVGRAAGNIDDLGGPDIRAIADVEQAKLSATIFDPNAAYNIDTEVCLVVETDVAITIETIKVTCGANPTTQLDWDLYFADAFIGMANQTLIRAMDTTAGVLDTSTGFTDATVPAGKTIYTKFAVQPEAAMSQVSVQIIYTID